MRWFQTERRIERINEVLSQKWSELVADHSLVAALSPRQERSAFDYWCNDHTYDCSALRETGFQFSVENPRAAFRETLDWYEANRWIPNRADRLSKVNAVPNLS